MSASEVMRIGLRHQVQTEKERGDTEMRRLMPKYELPAYALKKWIPTIKAASKISQKI